MDESAEVVIVGGGVMGASIAYHLTTLGVTDLVLLERNELASGSTSKSAGGIRAQFASEVDFDCSCASGPGLKTVWPPGWTTRPAQPHKGEDPAARYLVWSEDPAG